MSSKKSSKAAEALFRKQDKAAAMTDYQQRQLAEDEKTARLKALRLAKEAAEREAAEQAAAEAAARRRVDEGSDQRPLASHDFVFDDAIVIVEDKRVRQSRQVDEPCEDDQAGEQPPLDRGGSRGFAAWRR